MVKKCPIGRGRAVGAGGVTEVPSLGAILQRDIGVELFADTLVVDQLRIIMRSVQEGDGIVSLQALHEFRGANPSGIHVQHIERAGLDTHLFEKADTALIEGQGIAKQVACFGL